MGGGEGAWPGTRGACSRCCGGRGQSAATLRRPSGDCVGASEVVSGIRRPRTVPQQVTCSKAMPPILPGVEGRATRPPGIPMPHVCHCRGTVLTRRHQQQERQEKFQPHGWRRLQVTGAGARDSRQGLGAGAKARSSDVGNCPDLKPTKFWVPCVAPGWQRSTPVTQAHVVEHPCIQIASRRSL